MNKEEAKIWLSAHVPGQESEQDPSMQQALNMAKEDPELQAWLESRLRLDSSMRAFMATQQPPPDLKDALLKTVGAPPGDKPARRPLRRWLLGMAALLAVGLGTVFVIRESEPLVQDLQESLSGTSPESFDHFRDGMAYFIREVYFQLDHRSDQLPSIEAWLDERGAPRFQELPGGLAALNPIGCKQLTWKSLPVTLVCFRSGDGKIVHLFILDRQSANPDAYLDIESVATSNGLETGGWMTASAVYLLVGSDPDVDIEFALG